MDPLFQDERISAYLDGQMPPDERTQFEDELARNGELRQVVEELRGLHESLQALPRQRLGDDFAEHVLRRAERAMLADSRVGPSPVGAIVHPDAASAISETGKSRRPWIWAAIAIAVAVMLMVLNPPQSKHDKVVQLDSAPLARSPASAPQRRGPEESLHEPQFSARAGGVAADGSNNKRSDDFRSNAKESGVSQNGTAANADAVTQGAAAPATNLDRRREFAKTAAPAAPPAAAPQATAEKDTVAGGRLAQEGDAQFRENGIRSAAAPEGNAGAQPQLFAGSANQPSSKGAAADADKADEMPRGPQSGFGGNRGHSMQSRSLRHIPGELAKGELPAGDMIVAEVETRSEVSPAKLQQLLDKRGITLNNSPAALMALASAVHRASTMDKAQRSAASAGETSPVADFADKYAAAKAADKSRSLGEHSNQGATKSISGPETPAPFDALKLADSDGEAQAKRAEDESLEVVYVVGTRQQVLGLVDDLHSQPAQYRTLAITTMSPEATDGLEKDAKAPESRFVVDDRAAGAKSDRNGDELGMARKLPQAFAPAAAPVPAAAPTAPSKPGSALAADGQARGTVAPSVAKKDNAKEFAGGHAVANKPGAVAAPTDAPILVEQKAVEPAPATESPAAEAPAAAAPSPVAADVEAAAEPAERSSGAGWAARMPLPPEAENLLRKSLADRENPPGLDKGKAEAQWKQQAVLRDSLGRSEESGAPGDQVQAVLVFRLVPGKARPGVGGPGK